MQKKKTLLTEGSSLTARETLTALATSGLEVDVLSCQTAPLAAFSGLRHRVLRAPGSGSHPAAYLRRVASLLETGEYLALLPTHEQAWLLAEGRALLPPGAPVALAPAEAFRQVQGKIAFAKLAGKLGLPCPAFQIAGAGNPPSLLCPYWLKADFGTAGRSVYKVTRPGGFYAGQRALAPDGGPLLAQAHVDGQYGQVGAVFAEGRLLAAHTTLLVATGAGGSAAARISVDMPATRTHIAKLGAHLGWRGALTLDFILRGGKPYYIECNPRMVEPANAARAGVNFPLLLVALSCGRPPPPRPLVGRAGVRTHSTMALLLGEAERGAGRGTLVRTGAQAIRERGPYRGSTEVLAPLRQDPISAIPLGAVWARLLLSPAAGKRIAQGAVDAYSVPPDAIQLLRRPFPKTPPAARAGR